MKMPGFTADASLGRTELQYRAVTVFTPGSSLVQAARSRYTSRYFYGISTKVASTRNCCQECMDRCVSACKLYHPKADCIIQCTPGCNSECEAYGRFGGRGCAVADV